MHSPAIRFRRTAVGATAAALLLAGCGALPSDGSGGAGNGRQVAAAFYPLAYVAERVAGEHADVSNLTQPGGEPHDLELAIRETAEIAEADLVVFERGFQPAVDSAVERGRHGRGDRRGRGGATCCRSRSTTRRRGTPTTHEEHGDLDPHFWQDPLRMADLGDAVADKLAELDPDHADDYSANAADLRADLEDARRRVRRPTCVLHT